MQHFNTTSNEYSVIFTSGATEALKTVAESFEFSGNTSKQLNDATSTGKSQTFVFNLFIRLGDSMFPDKTTKINKIIVKLKKNSCLGLTILRHASQVRASLKTNNIF